MSAKIAEEEIVWTPQMPDRRKNDRRGNAREFHPNGKAMSIENQNTISDRRHCNDRRKTVSVTITGRAMDVEEARRP